VLKTRFVIPAESPPQYDVDAVENLREQFWREPPGPVGQKGPGARGDLTAVWGGINVFPGASAQTRLLVNGTQTTVAIRLRFSGLP